MSSTQTELLSYLFAPLGFVIFIRLPFVSRFFVNEYVRVRLYFRCITSVLVMCGGRMWDTKRVRKHNNIILQSAIYVSFFGALDLF